jgi:hypothetical protein
MANKDLDLPSVKEMLATVRCEEIALAAVKEIKALFKDDRARLEQGHVVSGLGERIQREHKHAMGMFCIGTLACRIPMHVLVPLLDKLLMSVRESGSIIHSD